MGDRPRGLGPADLLTAEELGRWLHRRPADAVDYVRSLGVAPIEGGAALWCVGWILDAIRRPAHPPATRKPTRRDEPRRVSVD